MAWDAQSVAALAGVVVAPAAALAGAWVNSYLGRKDRSIAQAEALRRDAARAAGPMLGILVDANPDLITASQLREYGTPQDAIDGLYRRWTRAREPLLVLYFGYPSPQVRKLAFELQEHVEMCLRETAKSLESPDRRTEQGWSNITARDYWTIAARTASAFTEHITGQTSGDREA